MTQSIDIAPVNDQYYDSADQLLEEDDLVEMDVRVLGWQRKFRIRALTFDQILKINTNATDEKTGLLNDSLFTIWTITEGVVRPHFTFEKAKRLVGKNGEHVRELADQIWNIGRLNKKVFDNYIKELERATEERNKDEKEKNTASKRSSRKNTI